MSIQNIRKKVKLTKAEKADIEKRFASGEMGFIEYRDFKLKTGYGVCRFCGRVVKFGNIMLYKIMANHNCTHGKPCWANKKTGCNVPKKWHCPDCYDEWLIRSKNRRTPNPTGRR